jgi:NAD-dependent deacetylase
MRRRQVGLRPGSVTASDTRIELSDGARVCLFIGAGMSAESGVPTYRGAGGIWGQYDYQEVACQRAFDRQPVTVLDFHERRRASVLACAPHDGHRHVAALQARYPDQVSVVTQNIDGMLQRAGVAVDAELHGSLWRMRCAIHGVSDDRAAASFATRHCHMCGGWLRPDITWFEDIVNATVFDTATGLIAASEWLVAVGTTASVYPAASFLPFARERGVRMVEVNPEASDMSDLFEQVMRQPASTALPALLPLA